MESLSPSEELAPRLKWLLRKQMTMASGRCDAFLFAMNCEGNIALIQAQIDEAAHDLADPPSALEHALAPNTAPRIYKEAYVAALREAVELLTSAQLPSDG